MFIKRKTKVLIRTFTVRRDLQIFGLFSRILENDNFDVRITSLANVYTNCKYWKPDIVVVNSLAGILKIRKAYSATKIVFYDPEGFHLDHFSLHELINADPKSRDEIDFYLLWGEAKRKEFLQNIPKVDEKKVRVVGSLKQDIIDFLKSKNLKKKNSVGIVSRFLNVNPGHGRNLINSIFNKGNFERVMNQCSEFIETIKIIEKILKDTDYVISYRPHPLENIEQAKKFFKKKQFLEFHDRLIVDESISFAMWVKKQSYLIGPISSGIYETFSLKIPYISIENISNSLYMNKKFTLTRLWQKCCFNPKSPKELLEILKKKKSFKFENKKMSKLIDDYCIGNPSVSASHMLLNFFKDISKRNNVKSNFSIPSWVIDIINYLRNRRFQLTNPLFFSVNYDSLEHKIPRFYKQLAEITSKEKSL